MAAPAPRGAADDRLPCDYCARLVPRSQLAHDGRAYDVIDGRHHSTFICSDCQARAARAPEVKP